MNQELPTSCLNCATPLQGAYCHHCGQKNLPAKLSVVQLLLVFFGEFFNYDGLVFRSIRLLITRPAELTIAYMEGKRTNFVNPVRFYLFTSALYFLCITYLVVPPPLTLRSSDSTTQLSIQQVDESVPESMAKGFLDGIVEEEEVDAVGGSVIKSEFESYPEYLAHQRTLPPQDRATEFELRFIQKFYEIKSNYGDDTSFTSAFGNEVLKRLPQLLLLTLPLLALVSKLVFFRRRNYWYIDHLIFVLHVATSLFFLLFMQLGLDWVVRVTSQNWLEVVGIALGFGWIGYVVLSFKRFFQKTWGKTVLLFLWTAFLQGVVLAVVFTFLLAISFFSL